MGQVLKGTEVLVVGLARSGEAAARLLLQQGARVTVTDRRSPEDLGPVVKRLAQQGVRMVLGEHPRHVFLDTSLIVLSPGVPRNLEPLFEAQQAGIEIITELELGARHIDFPLVAVTGTNGKSTTTTFIGHFLRGVGRRVFVGGNLGTPLCSAVEGDHDIGVVEVSSYQLEWSPTFRPEVAVLLNITEDHLDRYQGFNEYAETKGRIFSQQRNIDFAVVNQEDPLTLELASRGVAQIYTFGLSTAVSRGMRYQNGALSIGEDERWMQISLEGFKPRGSHNVENLMAAFLAARLAGAPTRQLEELIPHLEGLPHRLEFVRELEGVKYYNDSKATNVRSVVCSLRDCEEPLVLLMGGRDKGGSYAPLESIVRGRARAVVVFGAARHLIRAALDGMTTVVETTTLEEAVLEAKSLAMPGDSVVLSPACSSFDQFPNYEVRGDTFKQIVWSFSTSAPEPECTENVG